MMNQKRNATKSNAGRRWTSIVPCLAFTILCLFLPYADASGKTGNAPCIIPPPQGLALSSAPETHGPDTLYEKIDGHAELYLSAGFVALQSQWYNAVDSVDAMVEVHIYDMGRPMNAFSVFSVQRRDDFQPLDLTRFAYRTEDSIYLAHGPYYVEIVSTDPFDGRTSMLKSLAERFIRDTPVKSETIEQLALFPTENLTRAGVSMISRDAFGFEGLDNVFTAAYTLKGGEATAWLSKRKTSEEARELSRRLHAYFKDYGGENIEPDVPIEGARMIEIMDSFELMFSIGEYAAGVHEAPTREVAEKIAGRLAASLRK